MPQVSIIILNYNTFQLTCNCIESIFQFTKDVEFEIILVDNNSTECDAKLFSARYPNIQLIKSNENGGFAKGNNLGIQQVKSEYILLLNSDTYLVEDAISKCFQHIQKEKLNNVIGCKMIYPNGKIQHTARRFRSISWEILDVFRVILFLLPYQKRAKIMLGKYFDADFNIECDWLNGAFFMFPKLALKLLPNQKLDERFFMYGEDHLWCWQFLQVGIPSYFFSETKIVHINNASTSSEKRLRLRKVMLHNELEIMKYRKGEGLYYFLFKLIYSAKENFRIFVFKILKK